MEEPGGLQSMGSLRVGHDRATSLSLFHFHAMKKEMATHSSVLAWRIPGAGEPGGLTSMGSHRVGHDWSDLAAAAVNKASGCDGIPAELFKTLKDYTIKVLNYQSIKVLSTRKWPLDWKSQSSSHFPRRTVLRNVQTTGQLHSQLEYSSKAMLKIPQVRL